jgi:hypothetical protein
MAKGTARAGAMVLGVASRSAYNWGMHNVAPAMPWGPKEKADWAKKQVVQRSYQSDVVSKIDRLRDRFEVVSYGALSIDPSKYPVFMLKTKEFDPSRKTVLITGGVHGYETSGVHGALAFMETKAAGYESNFNFVCAPCLSPWAYETVNRWNNLAIDPNRSFHAGSPADECRLFLDAMAPIRAELFAHFDLHETTDTDNTVFRLALAERDAKPQEYSDIPDGFYVVGDTRNPQLGFQKAVIEAVARVTHIALPDERGMIIGAEVQAPGVIYYDMKKLFLCGGFSDAEFQTTTEVYPDSPKVNAQMCNDAQAAAMCGGLDFIK